MNYHIVRTNEKIDSIINLYNLTLDEIKDLNTHISNWNNLIPGTRLKLPSISDALTNEINDIEPFIEDYYPRIDIKKYESSNQKEDMEEPINEQEIDKKTSSEDNEYQTEDVKEIVEEKIDKNNDYYNSINLPPSYKYYYNPYDYYRYLRRKSNKK